MVLAPQVSLEAYVFGGAIMESLVGPGYGGSASLSILSHDLVRNQ